MIPSVYLFMATRGVFINQHAFLSQHCLILKILDLDLPEAYFPHSSYMIVLACLWITGRRISKPNLLSLNQKDINSPKTALFWYTITHTHTHICLIYMHTCTYSPGSSAGKESGCDTGDHGSILGSGRSPREGICYPLQNSWASLMAQMVKNLPIVQEIWVGKIPWRRAWQPSPVLLPGESPWTEESSGIQSMGSQRVRHTHDYIHI